MTTDGIARRGFLQASALGLAAGLAPRAAGAQSAGIAAPEPGYEGSEALPVEPVGRPQPSVENPPRQAFDRQLGWAVCGLGHFAQNYAVPGIDRAERARLTGLISGNPEKATQFGDGWNIGADHIYGYDMTGLADDDAIDVVYVLTPNAIHEEPVVRALEAGKHVLCEKPMATSPEACPRMIDAARAADRKLMVAYRAHFEPHNVKAKEMLDEGVFGDVWFATSDHHRPLDPQALQDQWRMQKPIAGGGSLPDIGIYAFNGIIYFFGESPSRVLASIASPPDDERFTEVEAFSRVQFEFPSGRTAQISSGYTGAKKRIDLIGSAATATLDPATEYSGNRLLVISPQGSDDVATEQTSDTQFPGEIDHFCEAIQDGIAIRTPGEMGLRDVRLIEAIYRSAEAGTWLDLNDDGSVRET